MKNIFDKIKKNKSFIIPWIVLGISLIIFASGLTYAYFDFVVDNEDESSLKVTATDFNVSLITTPVTLTGLMPIYDEYANTQAESFEFEVRNQSRKLHSCTSLALKFDSISPALISSSVKWNLVRGSFSVSGDFSTVNNNQLVLINNLQLYSQTNYAYTLRIWISNSDEEDQSELMNSSFSANISMSAYSGICSYEFAYVYEYNGTYQEFIAPATANYRVQLWGAQAYGTSNYGAYTEGRIPLERGEKLYVYVGKGGQNIPNLITFNSGTSSGGGRSGGGATDVRYFGDTPFTDSDLNWNSVLGLNSRIMVAAGSGSGLANTLSNLGSGGGFVGYDGTVSGSGGKQNGSGISQVYTSSMFGISDGGCSGGNGYYSGGNSTCDRVAGGGSSFISGHAGCLAIASATDNGAVRQLKSGCTSTSTSVACSTHYSGKFFTSTIMIDGEGYQWTTVRTTQIGMPTPTVGRYSLGIGNTGDGHAKISMMAYYLAVNLNGGTRGYYNFTGTKYYPGRQYYIEPPVREGFTFGGWTVTGEGTSINQNNILTMGNENSSITAIWN